jgi:lipopolysaccharide/colanic/teichoic acid biosynthesis glycosyltransferase
MTRAVGTRTARDGRRRDAGPAIGSQTQVDAASRRRGRSRRGWRTKRLFDLVAAALILIVSAPVMLTIAVAVRLSSPGGALFRQTRLGLGERPFLLYKFRTMYTGCPDDIHRFYVQRLLSDDGSAPREADGVFKIEADPRITPIGAFLRRTSLDELPQLFNVLRGDMSLVGPRPVLPWEADLFSTGHRARFRVPAGVTGLWQVSGRNRLTMKEALDLDVTYVQRRGFTTDLLILLRTVPVVLRRRGVR